VSNVQILTIGIAISTSFIAVLVGVLLNNNRLNDVKDLLSAKVVASQSQLELLVEKTRSEVSASQSELRLLVEKIRSEVSASQSQLQLLMEKNHSEIMLKLADIAGRVGRLEHERKNVP